MQTATTNLKVSCFPGVETGFLDMSDSDDDMFEVKSTGPVGSKIHQTQDDCMNFAQRQKQCDVVTKSSSLKGLINTREAIRLLQSDNLEAQSMQSTSATS
jgi:hypothetical protein